MTIRPLILIACLLSACATPKKLPSPAQTGPVALRVDFGKEHRARYGSDTAQGIRTTPMAVGGGLIPALLAEGMVAISQAGGQRRVNEVSAKTGRFEQAVVTEKVSRTLTSRGYTLKADAPVVLEVKVQEYGIWKGDGEFTFPYIAGGATLRDSNRKKLWSGQARNIQTVWRHLEEYPQNPSLYRADFPAAATNFSLQLLKEH